MAPRGTKRKSTEEQEAAAKCQKIQKSLSSALLKGLAKVALLSFKEGRHAYENEVVDDIGQALDAVAAEKSVAIEKMHAAVQGAPAEKSARTSALQEAGEAVAKAAAEVVAKKAELKTAEQATGQAQKALKEAKDVEKKENKQLHALEASKAELQRAASMLDEGDRHVTKLVKTVKDFEVDSSLLSALPNAVKEPAATRSAFNQTTIDQFKAALAAALAKKDEAIAAASPEATVRKDAVSAATEALEKAKAAEGEVAKALADSQEQDKEAKKAAAAAKKKVTNYYPDMKSLMDGYDQAKEALTDFNTDVLGAFKELKDRQAPPPEPEPEAAAEGEAEPEGEA
eukprot:TRINITY_DN13696_c0_g1_i1.p1 TRINITY_DN13696_c0_g1~~TRINITY_DN13696_c0_g1_i1.p1  ORF type:complete len:342 (-),score=145.15 TRINITY_DN13696_c0_g1_i1:284-1309(-)